MKSRLIMLTLAFATVLSIPLSAGPDFTLAKYVPEDMHLVADGKYTKERDQIMKACWDDPRILEQSDPYYGGQATGAMWAGMAPEAPFTPSHGYKAQAIDITAKEAIVPIFEGEKSVEQGLKDAADAVRELIGA